MIKLIQNIDIYAPEHLGKKDVLIIHDKIVKIADPGSLSIPSYFPEAKQIDGTNLILTPGFIDCHVHVLGGGGEGGFANRTPEATMEGLTKFGVTTVVGCLGTDGIGRDMCALVAKTKGLNEQGISAYCYTGSYQVPVRTLTDSIPKDIMMIQEIIGTGEIAKFGKPFHGGLWCTIGKTALAAASEYMNMTVNETRCEDQICSINLLRLWKKGCAYHSR